MFSSVGLLRIYDLQRRDETEAPIHVARGLWLSDCCVFLACISTRDSGSDGEDDSWGAEWPAWSSTACFPKPGCTS